MALVLCVSIPFPVFAADNDQIPDGMVLPLPPDTEEDYDPYPIASYAYNYNTIPAEMLDNTILRALAYTGYDVQHQKDTKTLYAYNYFGNRLKKNDPDVLSGIPYSSGSGSGLQTVSDSSTPTGLAPDIAYFRDVTGLDCADFVTYYLCNYLPNIEGIDTSIFTEYSRSLGYRQDDMRFWQAACDDMASKGLLEATYLTESDGQNNTEAYRTALANAVPGDLIRMGTASNAYVHYAIYAGYYDGEYYIIHVGNSRGPEISLVRYMNGPSSSKRSVPLAIYHFSWNNTHQAGSIQVNKTNTAGSALAGAEFTATNVATGKSYLIGPTDSNGYAKADEIPFGTYDVVETKFPSGYQASGTSSWIVTLDESTPNGTITINAINERIKGTAVIQKTTTNGGTLAGWHFEVKSAAGTVIGNYVTDSTGRISLELEPGTYTITETDGAYPYWINDPQPCKTLTVEAGKTATVTFFNQFIGKARILKTLADPAVGSLEGWTFEVTDAHGQLVGKYLTDAGGMITLDLQPGTYTVTEILDETSLWYCDSDRSQILTVTAGQTSTVRFVNALRTGKIDILKVNTNGQPLAGVEFLLEWSADGETWYPVHHADPSSTAVGGCSSGGLSDGKLRSDENGLVTFSGLYPTLHYRLTETQTLDGYQLLADYAYIGTLPTEDDLTVSLTVVNSEVFQLPMTGSSSILLFPAALALCLLTCTGALLYLRRKAG